MSIDLKLNYFIKGNLYVVTLGSRKILCINSDINKPEIPLYKINTLCKKVKKKEDEKIPYCPYFENSSDPNLSFAYLVLKILLLNLNN